jgi:hypothetical protein
MSDLGRLAYQTLNRLAKWRAHFAGWQLGTRARGDPEAEAVRDTQERLLLMRAELTALTRVMLDKGLVTQDDIQSAVVIEAEALMHALEARWPGMKATDDGLSMNAHEILAAGWMRGWKP